MATQEDLEESRLQQILLQQLQSLQSAGVRQLPRAGILPRAIPSGKPDQPPATSLSLVPEMQSTPSPENALEQLELLRQEVAGCTVCDELAAARTQTVFGVGNPQARLCFFGEAPGRDEDRQGEPFVGRAGKLLTDIIHKGMQLQR